MGEEHIPTVKGPMSLTAALEYETDILPTLTALPNIVDFRYNQLEARQSQIEALVSRHLNLPTTKFVLRPTSEWIYGGFNICLPIDIRDTRSNRLPRKVLLRIAMPYAVGESYAPGTLDEKVRCEAATYVWLERECPNIPIPRLLGMGFPGSKSFSDVDNESWLNWTIWHIRRAAMWFQGSNLPRFFAHNRVMLQDLGYILIECVEDGAMLSSSWNLRDDPQKRKNLYSGLANILLELSKVPVPRIGSWTMDNNGTISLTNRPFNDLTAFWHRHRVPLDIPRHLTYSSVESYIHDRLAYQDARIQHQPNSVLDKDDGLFQLSALVGLRAIMPRLFTTRSNREQFVMRFSDMHRSNIFVDEDWNITRIIDLEFAHSCPIELVHAPSWLSGRGVDELEGANKEEYKALYDEFVEAVAERERATQLDNNTFSQRLRDDWETGRLWYSMALGSLNAFPSIFQTHLRPRYFREWQLESHAWPLAQLWTEDVSEFLEKKAHSLQEYNAEVRRIFNGIAESQRALDGQPATASPDRDNAA